MVLPEWFEKADVAVKVALIAALASLATSALTVLHSFLAPHSNIGLRNGRSVLD